MFPRVPSIYRALFVIIFTAVLTYTILVQNINVEFRKNNNLSWKGNFYTRWTSLNTTINMLQSTKRIKLSTPEAEVTKSSHQAQSTKAPVVNPHNFKYILNPKHLCSKNNVYIIIYIHTAPGNFHKRQTVRQTWGGKQIIQRFRAKLVFIMGKSTDKKLMEKIQMEYDHYGDIVQEDFLDTYRNLTYKGICALKWLSTHCNSATFALKTDDDILVNIFVLVKYLKQNIVKIHGKNGIILCNQWLRMKVLRDKKSKWYIPKEDFEPDYFPPYCSGSAFVFSMDVVRAMYNASFYAPFFWVDDYYITGVLARHIKTKQTRMNQAYILNGRVVVDKLKNDTQNKLVFFHVPKLNTIHSMWNILKSRMNIKGDTFTWKPVITT